ncbi:hypothetical protein CEXT_563871 [Caerostris extrusa]|uniref:Uncharacterized protein n=1 Tax=Caerostris extrusa TaxID=172846 RepID=A0AAV4XH02_CAEEX|nr:hypothetical protein CEXT_563871 [Caerostris extrusa]
METMGLWVNGVVYAIPRTPGKWAHKKCQTRLENYVETNNEERHLSNLISNSARRHAQLKRPFSRMLVLQQQQRSVRPVANSFRVVQVGGGYSNGACLAIPWHPGKWAHRAIESGRNAFFERLCNNER